MSTLRNGPPSWLRGRALQSAGCAAECHDRGNRHPTQSRTPGRAFGLIVLLLFICASSGAKAKTEIADGHSATGGVREAVVNSHRVQLPIVDSADIRFLRFETLEGPSKSNALPILQDNQGFLWFGTPYGLNRFDGYTFRVFTHDPGNPRSISGSLITALFEDRAGRLWIGCSQFLNRLDTQTETFTQYPVPYVHDISQDASGKLWLSTPTGLYTLDPASGIIRRYAHDPNDPASLESSEIKSTGEDREGRFWIATNEGLDAFDRRTGKVTLHIPTRESSDTFSFYEDRFGVFWIYHTSGDPLAVYDRRTNVLTRYSLQEESASTSSLTGVTGMLEDRDGTLWLSTNGAGLLKFDRKNQKFIRYRHSLGDPYSLAQNSIRCMFADREGVIWLSLGGYGLTRFTPKPLAFQRFRSDVANADRYEPFVGAILKDDQGVLWIGTHSALHRIDRKTGESRDFELTEHGQGTDAITICQDRSGNLWIGTYGHGLFRLNPRTFQIRRFRHDPDVPSSLSNDIVARVFTDRNGNVWTATHDGLDRYDPATDQFTTYRTNVEGIHPYYLGEGEDSKGIIWLGTESSGLLRFDPRTGQFRLYQHQFRDPRSLSDNRVNSVYFDRTGTMWVGTQDGLDRFDEKSAGFITFSRRDGLPGNAVSCILEDGRSNLWMSTENGITEFDPRTHQVASYSTADGLPGPDLTGWGTCFRDSRGEMFFGGFSGATAFFPQNATESSWVPPVVLTDFRLFGSSVLPGRGSPLDETINYTDTVTLTHDQNKFSVAFSALSYLNPAANRYRYMLEGLDKQWVTVGSDERIASYTTLPAGTYTFRVQGATSRGPWSEPGAVLRIRILPAWWDTWQFRTCCVVAVGLVTALVFMRHKRQMRLEWLRNERLRQARADLAHVNRVSMLGELTASLAHDIKQPMAAALMNANTCMLWLNREPSDIEMAQSAATRIVNDLTHASEIIGRIRQLFKKETVEQELVDMNKLITEMADLMHSEAVRNGVSVRLELDPALPPIVGDRVGLQQVLLNLMLNGIEAIRDTGSAGILSVTSRLHDESALEIAVSDTGPGVAAGREHEIFDTFFTTKSRGTGMGLSISRSIVEEHDGQLWVTKNEPHGAVFHFTIAHKMEAHIESHQGTARV